MRKTKSQINRRIIKLNHLRQQEYDNIVAEVFLKYKMYGIMPYIPSPKLRKLL